MLGEKDASGDDIPFDAWSDRLRSTLDACGVADSLMKADHEQSSLVKHIISLSVGSHLASTVTAAASAHAAYHALRDRERVYKLQRPAVRVSTATMGPDSMKIVLAVGVFSPSGVVRNSRRRRPTRGAAMPFRSIKSTRPVAASGRGSYPRAVVRQSRARVRDLAMTLSCGHDTCLAAG